MSANDPRATGPTTEAGKTISRANSVRHGLSGQGIVREIKAELDAERKAAAERQKSEQMKPQ